MSSVYVSHVSKSVDVSELQEFFSFCGNIESINALDFDKDGYNSFQVNFTLEKALSTALLLNDAELKSVPVNVSEASLPSYEQSAKHSAISGLDNKIQPDLVVTGDSKYDDISQEEKPKLAILAQLLARGYKVSDDLIAKAIKVDNEKGFSAKFKTFLSDLDSKYLHTQDPESSTSKNLGKAQSQFSSLATLVQNSTYLQKLHLYFDKASTSPYGMKVHEFYKLVAKEVSDVHKEATRLAGLKKQPEASATSQPVEAATTSTLDEKTA